MLTVIFEKLVVNLGEKEVNSFSSWLYVMVKNQCVSKLRTVQTEQKRKQRYVDYVKHMKVPQEFLESPAAESEKIEEKEEKLKQLVHCVKSHRKN